MPTDALANTETEVPAVTDWLNKLNLAQETAVEAIKSANNKSSEFANRRRRTYAITVSDLVLLSTRDLVPEACQGARRLMPKFSGRCRDMAPINDITIRLELSQAVLNRGIHNASHPSLLKRYRADPYNRVSPAPLPATYPDGLVEYEVDYMVPSRQRRGRPQYRV